MSLIVKGIRFDAITSLFVRFSFRYQYLAMLCKYVSVCTLVSFGKNEW